MGKVWSAHTAVLLTMIVLVAALGSAQTLTPSSVTFTSTVVGGSRGPIYLTLTNGTQSPLLISSIAVTGNFSETSACPLAPKTLAAGASCKLGVTFRPLIIGLQSGVLTVSDNGPNSPQTAQLSGTGIAPVTLSSGTLAFGNEFVDTTRAARNVTLTNNQSVPLTISSIVMAGDFSENSTCPIAPNTLGAKSSCTISVTFTPTTLGTRAGTVTISDSASNSPQTVTLSGTGTNPATLTPSSVVFANQIVGATSGAKTITLKNVQTVPLTLFSIATSGDFAETSPCPISPQTLAAGASCAISVTFTPTMLGTRTGTLTVTDNAGLNTETSNLSGTGTLTGLIAIAITPSSGQTPQGTQLQLSATGSLKSGRTVNITDAVTWASAAPTIAQVNSSGLVQALAVGNTSVSASYGLFNASAPITVTTPALGSINVIPSDSAVPLGANQQFTAVLNYNNGASKQATTAVTWSSSNTAVASIDNTGLATTLSSGSTTITATQGSISGSTGFTVTPPQCVAAPAGLVGWWTGDNDSVDLAGQNSGVLQNGAAFRSGEVGRGFTFAGNGASLLVNAPEYSPTAGTLMFWFLSTGGGSMTGSIVGAGNRAPGLSVDSNGNLVWEFGDLFGQSLGLVSANRWHHVALTYSTSGSEVSVVVYLDGSEVSTAIATPNLTWNPQVVFGSYLGSASNSFIGSMDEITILNQALNAQQIEQVYGTYSGGMCKPTLQGMSITPANPSMGPGGSLQLSAIGSYSDNSTHDLTSSAAWNSSNPADATIGVTGLAIGVAPGVTTIGAALEGQNASTTLNVGPSLASIQVSPLTATIAAGTGQQFTATGTYSDGSQQNLTTSVSWSTNPSFAPISANGLATGMMLGQTSVVATVGTINGSALLTVTSATLTGVTVSPANPSIAAGTTQAFTASGTFSDGSTQDLTTQVQWNSSNSSVATINTNGLAASFVAGQTSITATFGTASNSAVLTVTPGVLSSITITPANNSLLVGSTQQFTATGTFSDNTQQDLTSVSAWNSSNQNVATITASGLVTAAAAGVTTVNATFNSVNGYTALTVNNPPPELQSISVSPSSSSVAVGFSQQFTALGTFGDGSTHDITSLVQWSSSAAFVAAIGNTSGSYGLASGAGAGASTITASSGLVLGNASLTVTNALLASITVNPAGSVVPPGGSSQFTATGNFSDGTSSDLSSSVLWSSSYPTVATISNTQGSQGLATGTSPGSTRISAAYNSLLDSTTLTVQDQLVSIAIVPSSALLAPDSSQQFRAMGTYLSGVQQDLTNQVAWTSSNPAVAVINSSGLAVSATIGQTTIAAVLGSLTSDANLGVTPIQHVVLIVQENRTTDNLFQDPNLIRAGADIQNYGMNSSGQTIPLSQIDLGTTGNNPDAYDIGHTHADFVAMCDLNSTTNTCKMDGADKQRTTCNKTLGPCPPPPNPQFMYVNPADVAPYFQMAEVYSFADRMFQTNQGPSLPAHQFIFAGTSAPSANSNEFAADDPLGIASRFSGCVAPPAMYVELINPSGVEGNTMYPCFEHATLSDSLDAANVSWRYYAPNVDGIWTAPTAINHICVPNEPPPNGTQCTGPDYTAASPKVVLEQSQSNAHILTDIASNQLAQVSWVMPPGSASDHAQSLGCGPSWVTSIVNAVGNSPYWSNTAIIITWDDWGGWYDHVPPPIVNDGVSWGSGYIYGFRVPLVVISPYAKAGYISHAMHDFGSILKFVEGTFNLPSLGYADVKADDLGDIFQYSQTPLPFTQITPPSNNATCSADPSFTDPDDD